MENQNASKIQLRSDTSQNWFSVNPILSKGEIGVEIDKNRMKLGDGVSHYNDLEYFSDTLDYTDLVNKPQINSVGLIGNLSLHELGIQAEGDYATKTELEEGLELKADKEDTYNKVEVDTKLSEIIRIPVLDGHDGEFLYNKDGSVQWKDIDEVAVTNEELTAELENYAKKTDLETKADKSELANYVTSATANSTYLSKSDATSTYLSKVDAGSTYASKSELSTYLTKTDASNTYLSKDEASSTYATASSLSTYATKTELNKKANDADLSTVAKTGSYNDLTNKPSTYVLPTASTTQLGGVKVDGSTITISDGVISATGGSSGDSTDYNALSNKPQINSIELKGNKTLDALGIQAKGDYATKSELANKADTSALSAYATTSSVSSTYLSKSDATSTYATKESLSGYATTSALDSKANKSTTLSGYGITNAYTKSESDGKYALKTDLANKADTSALEAKADKETTLAGYGITDAYTKTASDGKYATKAQGTKADTAVQPDALDAYVTTETANTTYATKASLSGYATTTALDDKANKSTTLSGYGITDAYTKTEADGKYATKAQGTKADTAVQPSALSDYVTTETATSTYATKSELADKADTSALPSADVLMKGTAPTVQDIDGESVTEIAALIEALNTILGQLRTRGIIA